MNHKHGKPEQAKALSKEVKTSEGSSNSVSTTTNLRIRIPTTLGSSSDSSQAPADSLSPTSPTPGSRRIPLPPPLGPLDPGPRPLRGVALKRPSGSTLSPTRTGTGSLRSNRPRTTSDSSTEDPIGSHQTYRSGHYNSYFCLL